VRWLADQSVTKSHHEWAQYLLTGRSSLSTSRISTSFVHVDFFNQRCVAAALAFRRERQAERAIQLSWWNVCCNVLSSNLLVVVSFLWFWVMVTPHWSWLEFSVAWVWLFVSSASADQFCTSVLRIRSVRRFCRVRSTVDVCVAKGKRQCLSSYIWFESRVFRERLPTMIRHKPAF